MAKRHDGFGIDFGLSGLTSFFRYPTPLPGETEAVGLVAAVAGEYDGAYARQLLEDVQRLLESPLPDEAIVTLWLAATEGYFDPVAHGFDGRGWLRRIAEVALAEIRAGDSSFVPAAPEPVTDPELRSAVLAEIREVASALTEATLTSLYADPLPDVVPALERIVADADADLGFRLFLRVLKAYFVEIDEGRLYRFCALGERFGYHELVVEDGNLNIWSDLAD
ncbi:hypothetical protein ACWD25_59250 [Streptomyces sp. NPDC002920]